MSTRIRENEFGETEVKCSICQVWKLDDEFAVSETRNNYALYCGECQEEYHQMKSMMALNVKNLYKREAMDILEKLGYDISKPVFPQFKERHNLK